MPRRWLGGAAVLGAVLVPAVLWGLAPRVPARLESSDGFYWIGAGRDGAPLLLRELPDGRQIVAGSERFGMTADEPVRCADEVAGGTDGLASGRDGTLRTAAIARGRISDLSLRRGIFRRLTIVFDDLGGGATHYLYRCGSAGVLPLLSWSTLPAFGVRALAIGWLAWMLVCLTLARALRRRE